MGTSQYPRTQTAPPASPARARGAGSVYRRCGCRGPDGRQLGRHCPDLRDERHGTWTLDLRIPGAIGAGKARRLRRGGYATRAQADRARKNLLRAPTRRQRAAAWTTSSWLHHWLEGEQRWRDTTRRSYASHVEHYLEPYLGRVPLDELATWQVQAMFDDLARNPSPSGHMLAPATLVRLQATLRASLNAALRAGILETNPARWLRLPPHPHIRAEVCTPAGSPSGRRRESAPRPRSGRRSTWPNSSIIGPPWATRCSAVARHRAAWPPARRGMWTSMGGRRP